MADAKPMEVFSYGPVQQLYEAALAVVKAAEISTPEVMSAVSAKLKRAVEHIEECAQISLKLENVREKAAEIYIDSSCDVDIDEACLAHDSESGHYWVGAWLYVPYAAVGEAEAEDEDDETLTEEDEDGQDP